MLLLMMCLACRLRTLPKLVLLSQYYSYLITLSSSGYRVHYVLVIGFVWWRRGDVHCDIQGGGPRQLLHHDDRMPLPYLAVWVSNGQIDRSSAVAERSVEEFHEELPLRLCDGTLCASPYSM